MTKVSQKNSTSSTTSTTTTTTTTGTKVKRTRRSVPRDYPPQRSSIYRGVTRHRWTGRYEAHLWDKNCWNESQNKKGRQVYLGAYDDEEAAAHTYDLAALKYWGEDTILNFPVSTYETELKGMEGLSREEYIGSLRRKSSGFSRGVSKYRGVARHHHNGRWEARIGRVFGNKYLYLGTYATQEEAATAYDLAAIEYRGLNAVTNFDLSRYIKWLKPNNNVTDGIDASLINSNPTTQLNLNNYSNPSLAPSTNHQEHGGGLNFLINHPSGLSNHGDQPVVAASQPRSTTTTSTTAMSALGLLLQSSKFKEMMEMTSAVDQSASSTQPQPGHHHHHHHQSALPQCSFPKEIQTYFGSENPSSSYNEGGEFLFGDLNSFNPTMFPCDFEA